MNEFTPTDFWTLLIVAALTGCAALLAMAETSLTRMSRARAMHLQEEQRRGAAQLLSLVEQPARFLNLVLLLLLVVQFTATALFTSVMDRIVGGGLGVAIAAVVMTLITFIGAEVAPKTYAVQHTDRAALRIAPFVYLLVRLPVLGPLTRLLIGIGNVITPGKGLKSGPFISEDEIKAMVDEAERDEVIEEEEREMIHSIFEFGDTIVREVMVPRPDMVTVPNDTSLQEVLELILRTGYSRIPVYEGTVDEVAGLAYAKDVLRRLHDGQADKPLADILRPALFMPESMRAADCLREMRKRNSHMVIVIDEYGGTSGLVTLEDLLEE
ncbi:MAG TPA: hemolysin family protein, partial [Actinomycetota bacterium]|nr:hemolysin family protein [Actinomycetota bacterium]